MDIPPTPIGIIFVTSIYSFFVTYSWVLVSVVFSPFAAGICMWLARRRGLNVWHYGLIGAIYSLSFLYPWIYLATRLLGRRMSGKIVIAGYVNMYVWWVAWLFGMFLIADWNYRGDYGGDLVGLLGLVHVSISAIAVVGSLVLIALSIRNRNRREEFGQNVQPLLGGYTPSSRKLIAGYVAFCVIWFVLLFAVYGINTQLLYGSLVLMSSVLIAVPAIFALGPAWRLIRNRNRRVELGQDVQPFLGGYTPSSSDLIYIAPFAFGFVSVSVMFGVGNLL